MKARPMAAAASIVLLVATAIWFMLTVRTEAIRSREARRSSRGTATGTSAVISPSGSPVVHAELSPRDVDDESELPRIDLAPDAGTLSVMLRIEDGGFDTYNAELETEEAILIDRQQNLRSGRHRGGETLTVHYRASILANKDYRILLSGSPRGGATRAVATYEFRVRK